MFVYLHSKFGYGKKGSIKTLCSIAMSLSLLMLRCSGFMNDLLSHKFDLTNFANILF
jgi:hypothetical protein